MNTAQGARDNAAEIDTALAAFREWFATQREGFERESSAERPRFEAAAAKLPHITPEVAKQFDYRQDFADAMFSCVEAALR
jgi:hypothetical protein